MILYNDARNHITKLVDRVAVHAEVGIPKIVMYICQESDSTLGGFCSMSNGKIWIEFHVPEKFDFRKQKHHLTMVTVHEMCHYIFANSLSISGAKEDLTRYFNDPQYRNYDEARTWRATKVMLQELGLWTKPLAITFAKSQYIGKPSNL